MSSKESSKKPKQTRKRKQPVDQTNVAPPPDEELQAPEENLAHDLNDLRQQIEAQKKVTEKLENVPELLQQLLERMGPNENGNDEEMEVSEAWDLEEGTSKLADDDNFDDLLLSNDTSKNQTTSDHVSEECLKILEEDDSPPVYGPLLTEAVQKRFLSAIVKDNDKALTEKMKTKLLVPENCEFLTVPKINDEIWNGLPMPAKNVDTKLRFQQHVISKGLIALASIADVVTKNSGVIPKDVCESILKLSVDGSSFLAMGFRSSSYKRMAAVRPNIASQYAGICRQKSEPGPFLFGENLSEKIKTSRSMVSVLKQTLAPGPRFSPYSRGRPPLNFRGQPRSFSRGAMMRGRPIRYQSRFSQRPTSSPAQRQNQFQPSNQ